MKLILKQLSLTNFKGIKDLTVSFSEITNIEGANATGKSTIADAFTWLLFGKDMLDRKDFEVKTVDKNGNVIPRIDHTVTGLFEINFQTVKLDRTLREKWVKQRGDSVQEFHGNETLYLINDVPKSQKEYQDYINSIIPESTFKLLTVPTYFNSIKWQERRAFLTSIANVPSEDDIAGTDLKELIAKLRNENKSLVDFRKELANRKKLLKAQIEQIPGRLDEVNKSTPEAKDFAAIEIKIAELQKKIATIEAQIADSSKAVEADVAKRTKAIKAKADLELKIGDIATAARRQFSNQAGTKDSIISAHKEGIVKCKSSQETLKACHESALLEINALSETNKKLREDWSKLNATKFEFDNSKTICPTCKQELPAEDIAKQKQQMLANFNEQKQKDLGIINQKGKTNKEAIEQLEKDNAERQSEIAEQQLQIIEKEKQIQEVEKAPSSLKSVETILAEDPEYAKLKKQFDDFVIPTITVVEESDLVNTKQEYSKKLDALKADLQAKAIIEQHAKRKNELLAEEKLTAQLIADVENQESQADLFIKRQMSAVGESVNSMFPTVRWRMYEQQINGGESETCICLVGGVPYSDANRAAQLNAGIEILNVFSEKLGLTAPVWLDNSEAVNDVNTPNGQLITLQVTTYPKLLVTDVPQIKGVAQHGRNSKMLQVQKGGTCN